MLEFQKILQQHAQKGLLNYILSYQDLLAEVSNEELIFIGLFCVSMWMNLAIAFHLVFSVIGNKVYLDQDRSRRCDYLSQSVSLVYSMFVPYWSIFYMLFVCDKGFFFQDDECRQNPRKLLFVLLALFFSYQLVDFMLLIVIGGGRTEKHKTLAIHHFVYMSACIIGFNTGLDKVGFFIIAMLSWEFTTTWAQSHMLMRKHGAKLEYLYIHNCLTVAFWFAIRIVWASVFTFFMCPQIIYQELKLADSYQVIFSMCFMQLLPFFGLLLNFHWFQKWIHNGQSIFKKIKQAESSTDTLKHKPTTTIAQKSG